MNQNKKLKQRTIFATKPHVTILLLASVTVFFALTKPDACKTALVTGYQICVSQLLFALFPFLIAANLLVLCNIAPLIGHPLQPLCKHLGFAEPCVSGLFAIALLGGFAPAISALSQSVHQKQLSPQQATRLLPLICFLGPSYTIIAVGSGMLGSTRVGVYLFISQLLAGVLVVFFLRVFSNVTTHLMHRTNKKAAQQTTPLKEHKHTPNSRKQHQKKEPDFFATTALNETNHLPYPDFTISSVIADSFFAFLRLCGVILYFQFLSAGMCTFLPTQYQWLCELLLEVTAACTSIANNGTHAAVRCCAALGFLSASILLQASALCPNSVSCKTLLYSRLLHAPISLIIFRLFLYIPQTVPAYNSLHERTLPLQRLAPDQAILLFIALIFLAERLQKLNSSHSVQNIFR